MYGNWKLPSLIFFIKIKVAEALQLQPSTVNVFLILGNPKATLEEDISAPTGTPVLQNHNGDVVAQKQYTQKGLRQRSSLLQL